MDSGWLVLLWQRFWTLDCFLRLVGLDDLGPCTLLKHRLPFSCELECSEEGVLVYIFQSASWSFVLDCLSLRIAAFDNRGRQRQICVKASGDRKVVFVLISFLKFVHDAVWLTLAAHDLAHLRLYVNTVIAAADWRAQRGMLGCELWLLQVVRIGFHWVILTLVQVRITYFSIFRRL